MPLQSRASAARLARTNPEEAAQSAASTEPAGTIAETIQPRRGAAQSAPTAKFAPGEPKQPEAPHTTAQEPQASLGTGTVGELPEHPQATNGDQSQFNDGQATTPAPRTRKPRTVPVAKDPASLDTSGGESDGTDIKALKTRMSEIEKEFKTLPARETAERRELEARFKNERRALEDEHRALSVKVSAAVFHG